MLSIGETDFYIAVPSLPKHKFEKYSKNLFDDWEEYIGKALKLSDYALSLEVEEGSIKGSAKIAAAVGAIYLGIGQYGSFISGLQTIQGQVSSIGDFLATRAASPFQPNVTKPKIKKHAGTLGNLQKLFLKVQKGQLTPDQAMIAAEVILGDDVLDSPEFMAELKTSLKEVPALAKQLTLPLDIFEQDTLSIKTINHENKPRLPRPKPEPRLTQQFRVEVWRESKNKKRKFRIVEL